MKLYPQSKKALDPKLFANPTSEYRGCPFWSWNNKLDLDQLLRQIDILAAMGMGGPTIHCRTGMATPYLGQEFMAIVKKCTAQATKKGLLTWLYDEDRWPSGFAGGLVTKEKQYRLRHLLFTPRPYGRKADEMIVTSGAKATRRENGKLLARYDVRLNADGSLASFERVPAKQNKRQPAKDT